MAKRRMKKAAKSSKKSAMKAMRRRKAKKVSVIGKKWQVFKGTKVKTGGGLKKTDLIKNKHGKIVSRKRYVRGKKNTHAIKWGRAIVSARRQLGIKGFQAVGGKTAKGQALLKKVRSIFRN